jgi:predicted amidohydrolase YtcJ
LLLLSTPVFSSYGSGFHTNYPIISELSPLQLKIPWLLIDELIRMCTINPARAHNMDHHLGSFEVGKAPGINLITHIDFKEMKLTEKSELKVII